jgi:RNA polymerase-binding transcription factor DksA
MMLTDDERKMVEARLLGERERALDAIGDFDALSKDLREHAGELSLYDQHPADLGSESQEQEKHFLLASIEGRRLYAIDEALQRLYKTPEEFGRCAECGESIGMERLDVVPETTLCARHAQERDADADANPREADGRAREA